MEVGRDSRALGRSDSKSSALTLNEEFIHVFHSKVLCRKCLVLMTVVKLVMNEKFHTASTVH